MLFVVSNCRNIVTMTMTMTWHGERFIALASIRNEVVVCIANDAGSMQPSST